MASNHSGSRPVTRDDDKRLARTIKDPVREVIPIARNHRDEMALRYGDKWRGVVRELIKKHLEERS